MLKRALLYSLIAEALTTAAMLWTFRLASLEWGPAGMSEWVLARRVISLMLPAITCGLDVALTLASARHSGSLQAASADLIAASLPVLIACTLLLGVMELAPGAVSTLLFGGPEFSGLLRAVAAMLAAVSLHTLLFAYLRGTMQFLAANVLHFLVYGFLPVIAILLLSVTPQQTLLLLALATLLLVLAFASRWARIQPFRTRFIQPARRLLSDGLPRVPAAFGMLSLFALPTLIVAHTDNAVNAALVSLGLSIVTIAGSAFGPVALVLLPVVARAAHDRKAHALSGKTHYILPFAVLAGALVALTTFVFSDVMAEALLGRNDPTLSHIFRWVAPAAIPYIFFVCSRPLVDAHSSSFAVTRLVAVAVAVYPLSFWVCHGLLSIPPLDSCLRGYLLSMFVLGGGIFFQLRRSISATAP
jgi:O-antigen/teichoic acid export membrane protein